MTAKHLKRRARQLARKLKDGEFLDTWYNGKYFSRDAQQAQAAADLAGLRAELIAIADNSARKSNGTARNAAR